MTSRPTDVPRRKPFVPPRWFVRTAWIAHRAAYRATGGRRGLWRPKASGWGTMVVRTVGRRTGREREAILGYIEDGPNLITLAMNGWGEGEPKWWLNLLANPDATVTLKDGEVRRVHAHAAQGEERRRLWARWDGDDGPSLDDYALRRSTETAVVVLEPRPGD